MRQFVQRQNGSQTAPAASASARSKEADHRSHQRAAGPLNHSFTSIPVFAPAPIGVQTKLTIGEPGDVFEQEADRVADQVMRTGQPEAPARPRIARSTFASVQRTCLTCTSEGQHIAANDDDHEQSNDSGGLRAAEDGENDVAGITPLAPAPSAAIPATGSGSALSGGTRSFMEPRFGVDFGNVRIHTDSQAESLAQNLNARAFTVGQDIYFGNREYQPESQDGQRLLAHELTHVVQQSQTVAHRSIRSVNEPRIQRYLVGPPQRIGTTTTTPATYGNCRNFNWVVSWDTDVRDGYIVQEITNGDTITRCDGTTTAAPNVPHYWEAWHVDASGTVSDGNADTWFRAGKPGTRGRWTLDGNVFAVSSLDPGWGFSRGSVVTAGGLLATTTGPSYDELYQPSLVRHVGGEWDCCDGKNIHTPI